MTFQSTRWTLVLRARSDDAPGREALEQLCAAYWQPVYVLYRRLGAGRDEAADLTQGLFADLLARGDLAKATPERGRFRSFLRACARNWWNNQRESANARKRGGGLPVVPLEPDDAESWLHAQPVDTLDPEALYERRWACSVLERAVWRLEQAEIAADRGALFARLRGVLDGGPPALPWAELARQLGATEGGLKVAAHRLKARMRDLLLAEVRETLAEAHTSGEELQDLLSALQARTSVGAPRKNE